MTLILGLDCADGLLLACESQITYQTAGQPVKTMGDKIYLPWDNVAWGGSGHGGIIQRVDLELRRRWPERDHFETLPIATVRQELAVAVSQTVRQILNTQVVGAPDTNPWTSYLFIGHVPEGSFMVEISTDLVDSDHIATGYAAIGSGDIFPYFAMAGLAHYNVRARSLVQTRLIAHRIIQDAVSVAAFGIGGRIQMIEIAKPRQEGEPCQSKILLPDEIQALADRVVEWKVSEVDSLISFAPTEEGEAAP